MRDLLIFILVAAGLTGFGAILAFGVSGFFFDMSIEEKTFLTIMFPIAYGIFEIDRIRGK